MQLAALMLLTLVPGQATLSGTWLWNRVRSDFGGADAPTHYVLQIEQDRKDLGVAVLSDDGNGRRVTYRQCRADDEITGLLRCLTPDGPDETWRIRGDSLTVTRFAGRSHQRLVLERCTELE